MMRAIGVVLAAGLVGLGLAGCGDDDGGASGVTTTERPATEGEPPAGDSTTAPAAESPLDGIEITATPVAQVDSPTALVVRPGSPTMYVAERAGRVRPVTVTGTGPDRTYQVGDPVLDISANVVADGERGLLDIEYSDDGGTLYVHYSLAPGGDARVAAYTMAGDDVDTGSYRELLAVEDPYPNHNGGEMEFGPDGYLYIGLGDGGGGGDPEDNGQDTQALLGKILRIDPANPSGGREYGIPSDNPFADGEGGRPEVWLYGVRNPWRFETVGWSSSTSQPDARPSTMVPGISGNRRPASSPLTTTNSDEPAAVTGVRAAPTAACSGRVIATARPRRTVAPSWRPASPSSKSGSAGRSPISRVRSSPAVGSRARTRSATVAEGLLTRTSSSRRASPAT